MFTEVMVDFVLWDVLSYRLIFFVRWIESNIEHEIRPSFLSGSGGKLKLRSIPGCLTFLESLNCRSIFILKLTVFYQNSFEFSEWKLISRWFITCQDGCQWIHQKRVCYDDKTEFQKLQGRNFDGCSFRHLYNKNNQQ